MELNFQPAQADDSALLLVHQVTPPCDNHSHQWVEGGATSRNSCSPSTSREQARFSAFAITNGESEAQQGTAIDQFSTGGCAWQCYPAPEPAPLIPGPESMVWRWGQTTVVPAVPKRLSSPQHRELFWNSAAICTDPPEFMKVEQQGREVSPHVHVYAHPDGRAAVLREYKGTLGWGICGLHQ